MPIRIKIAQTAGELEDVFRLRHRVYVGQEGVFKDSSAAKSGLLFDRFDVLPPVANIIAYDGETPIGTMRINLDAGAGLPSDEFYDLTPYRTRITNEWMTTHDTPPRIGSAGMLAISGEWRHRRDVILALFKLGAGMGHEWKGTHIVATPSAKTTSMYERLGFEFLGEKYWVEDIGDHVLPMAGSFEAFYHWAFQGLEESHSFIDAFANRFQRLIFGAGETIFDEGDEGDEAYLVDNGSVRISTGAVEPERELTLSLVGAGALFGELSLIDSKPRSARAVAVTNTEVIALSREEFRKGLKDQPLRAHDMLALFAERIRRTDQLAAALYNTAVQRRMEYALEDIRNTAVPDSKRPGVRLAKVGLTEFAHNAGVSEQQARDYLEDQQQAQQIEYTERRIRFLTNA